MLFSQHRNWLHTKERNFESPDITVILLLVWKQWQFWTIAFNINFYVKDLLCTVTVIWTLKCHNMRFINLYISEKSIMDFSYGLSKHWWSEWGSAVVKTCPAVCVLPLHLSWGMYLKPSASPSENSAIKTTHLRFQEYQWITLKKLCLVAFFNSKLA